MKAEARFNNGKRRGQTLVMALIILGILLVLGAVFIALVHGNIRNATANRERSLAYDLAESGVRYAHSQMLNSVQGLDWRPVPTVLAFNGTYMDAPKGDPDYDYLRMPNPGDATDRGGPDKLGPYVRVNFDRGRALIRVRYAPSDPTVFSLTGFGDLIQPGMVRNYTMIESVGKARTVIPNDPTSSSLQSGQSRENTEQKKIIAFVSCGMIEYTRYEHNKYHVSAPAEIGWPSEPIAMYGDNGNPLAAVRPPVILGNASLMYNPWDPNTQPNPLPTVNPIPYGGGTFVNGDLLIHGNVVTELNSMMGDGLYVSGSIKGADNLATLHLDVARPDPVTPTQWLVQGFNLSNGSNPSLNSDSSFFSTLFGVLKDGLLAGDSQGFTRGIPSKESPSIERTDPDTGRNRYVQMTEYSGRVYDAGNGGRFGHGQGVYVNNSADLQVPADEQSRQDVGSAESLVYDWLNPNNGQANSGWQGAFYVPLGAYMVLQNDGFTILRDNNPKARPNERTWREPDGSPSKRAGAQMTSTNPADIVDSPYIRYKLVFDPATARTYVFNSYSVLPSGAVVDLNAVNSGTMNTYRDAGFPFNGVVTFAGNVRVRGQIPTNQQITVVSSGTIYIEGSITKGTEIVNPNGTLTRLQAPSKSMIALMAKDYVCLNTTQFFGTSPEQSLEEVNDNPGPAEYNPLIVRQRSSDNPGVMGFVNEFVLDPGTAGGNPNNPSTWQPSVLQYVEAGTNNFEPTNLLLTQTMADGPAPATFINFNVNYPVGTRFPDGTGEWQYMFDLSNFNAATPFYPPGYTHPNYAVPNRVPLYGLGGQSWQRYSKFEAGQFELVGPQSIWNPANMMIDGANTSPSGLYHLFANGKNEYGVSLLNGGVGGTPTNDYMIARAAVVPQDIRIEATLFAEEGSFFVIPGPWFNPNPNDRRDTYFGLGATPAERDLARLEDFGSTPNTPFYGEPLDVKISIFGSVTENMPPPIAQQAEWLKKWGWIPRYHGASNQLIPQQHANPYDVTPGGANQMYVPNITITYDPALATDRNQGFVGAFGSGIDTATLIRFQGIDLDGNGSNDLVYALPPLPRMPVSPTLAYFGEVNP